MKKINMRAIYITLFAILYVCVGLVSTIHAVSFFALANGAALAVILACAFEVGQAAVLFSILTDIRKRKKVMPWLLMGVLTIVQILGNIFSSYKYLITNSEEKLRYFKEPIFVWVQNMPDQNANVILCYVIGAILPIVSLLMTAMLTSYLEKEEDIEKEIEEIEETETNEEQNEEQPKAIIEWLDPVKQGIEEPEDQKKENLNEANFVPSLEDTPGKELYIEENDNESSQAEDKVNSQEELDSLPTEEDMNSIEEIKEESLDSHLIN